MTEIRSSQEQQSYIYRICRVHLGDMVGGISELKELDKLAIQLWENECTTQKRIQNI